MRGDSLRDRLLIQRDAITRATWWVSSEWFGEDMGDSFARGSFGRERGYRFVGGLKIRCRVFWCALGCF